MLALAAAVLGGCAIVEPLLPERPTPPPRPAHILTRVGVDEPCLNITGMDGELIADRAVGTRLIAPGLNREPPHNLVVEWPQGYTAAWDGDEVEVRDEEGSVRAVTGTTVHWVGSGIRAPEGVWWSGYWPEMPAGTLATYCGTEPVPWEGP